MKYSRAVVLLVALSGLGHALAAGGGGDGGGDQAGASQSDTFVRTAQAAIDNKDWAGAQAILQKALATNAKNADYHNLYAYSLRKSAHPNMAEVLAHYDEALRIDPMHLGAHEYMGEAYLMLGNLAKAREHLAALDRLCFFGCEQYSDLKNAVALYEASHPR